MELYFKIKKDAQNNEYSKILLSEIHKFANLNKKINYKRGEVTQIALYNMLTVIKTEENKVVKSFSYSGVLEQMIHQYLETDNGFQIGIKIK